jgi:hypothetical protein
VSTHTIVADDRQKLLSSFASATLVAVSIR